MGDSCIQLPNGDNNDSVPKLKAQVTESHFNLRSLVAGALAGAICTITCSPLDVTKVRMQVQGSLGLKKYSGSLINIIKIIHKEEGIHSNYRIEIMLESIF